MLLFNDEDKRELLEEVPIYNVCDFLGIEYQNTGCRKSILCPDHLNHNDQHYGSCFIYENTNTAHCFVCNKSFDTIDLLRLNGYGYYDALCQLANLSGSLSRFEKQPDKKQFWLPNLTKEERELIGLYPTKRIKLYYAIQENKPDDRKYDIIFGKEGEDDSFYYTKPLNIIHGSCYKKKIRKVIFLWFCISAWKQWSDIIFFMKKTKMHTLQVKGENFEKK